ncbi:MAG: transcriptional regulator [Betaproteobacteria bacterium RIFCSPLOWO2_02_FULL_62_17]|nr:MAG: transcriptional regulator [Betaproteobacteria bacterium RIFCSPLOWO2_02_FULL_62_17]
MYVPKYFEESDTAVLHALIQSHPLGAWVTQGNGELTVNHIPFLVDPSRGANGTLMGHVARANDVWQSYSKDILSVVVFQGPQAYITPSWYPSKRAHGKAVPTWNYAVVHAHGMPNAIEDREWLLRHVSQLTDMQESQQAVPWKVSDAPPDYIDTMLRSIVGIEMPISSLAGKWKLSQNRPPADKPGIIAGLLEREDAQSKEVAALVKQRVNRELAE